MGTHSSPLTCAGNAQHFLPTHHCSQFLKQMHSRPRSLAVTNAVPTCFIQQQIQHINRIHNQTSCILLTGSTLPLANRQHGLDNQSTTPLESTMRWRAKHVTKWRTIVAATHQHIRLKQLSKGNRAIETGWNNYQRENVPKRRTTSSAASSNTKISYG